MLIPTKEYTSAAEMLAYYGRTRRKFKDYERPELQPEPILHVTAWRIWLRRSIAVYLDANKEPVAHVQAWQRWQGRVTIMRVKYAATQVFGIAMDDLLSTSRKADLVEPRHITMAVAQLLTGHSLPELGRRFGGRDHTTILSAVRKMRDTINDVAPGMPPQATPEQWLQVVWWRLDNGAQ